MSAHASPSFAGLVLRMAVFVLLGFPLVGYLWETISELLALEVNGTRLLIAVPVAAALAALLVWLSRSVRRWLPAED
jgi:ABC-type uncharacterized transport system permease subunit